MKTVIAILNIDTECATDNESGTGAFSKVKSMFLGEIPWPSDTINLYCGSLSGYINIQPTVKPLKPTTAALSWRVRAHESAEFDQYPDGQMCLLAHTTELIQMGQFMNVSIAWKTRGEWITQQGTVVPNADISAYLPLALPPEIEI